jgi:hypothetical protein
LKSFESTGIWLMEKDIILKRFCSRTPDEADQPKSSPVLADKDWRRMRTLVEDVVREGEEKSAKKITHSLCHLQVQNDLLLHENKGLHMALTTKKKHKKKGKTLDLQQRQEFHGGAIFWSPRKVNKACFCERIRKCEEEEELSQKANNKHMREQAALWTKKQKEDRRVEHESLKVEREREKKRKAAERAELQRKKQEAKEATAVQKAVQSSQSVKRAASQKAGSKAKKACIVHAAEGSGRGGEPASAPPSKRTKTRSINLPAQYLDKPK